jgi:pyrimidine-nucleoside phosphorylase
VTALQLIQAKRDGREHTREELAFLARGAADGNIPDYQLAAWLMAAYLRPLSVQETAWLTLAMAESGQRVDLTGLPQPWVDKHSTGGVGDKTTLVLLPLLAACGLTMVKMSGRGLGITGGTVDKLESVPGFRLGLSPHEMKEQAAAIGLALTGQTPDLAPADKALYALRDVTGTVSSIPLIVSSILSKKIAGGAQTVVLDVKCGSGAFMKSLSEAEALREGLLAAGTAAGLNVRCVITDMHQPLGSAVGNALEVREAVSVLSGNDLAPNVGRFRDLCLELAAVTLDAVGTVDPLKTATRALTSGAAEEKASQWFVAQGASWPPNLAEARIQSPLLHSGTRASIANVFAGAVGEVAMELGAGRRTKGDVIDPAVGVEIRHLVGDTVSEGDVLAIVHANDPEKLDAALTRLRDAFEMSDTSVAPRQVVISGGLS